MFQDLPMSAEDFSVAIANSEEIIESGVFKVIDKHGIFLTLITECLHSDGCMANKVNDADNKEDKTETVAFVTIAIDDSLSHALLIQAASLRRVGTKAKLILIFGDILSEKELSDFRPIFDIIICIDHNNFIDKGILKFESCQECWLILSKIYCWSLIKFSKIVYLENDSLILANIDSLFTLDDLSRISDIDGNPFNSNDEGILILTPSCEVFDILLDHVVSSKKLLNGHQHCLFDIYATCFPDIQEKATYLPEQFILTVNSSLRAFERRKGAILILRGITGRVFQYLPDTTFNNDVTLPNDLLECESSIATGCSKTEIDEIDSAVVRNCCSIQYGIEQPFNMETNIPGQHMRSQSIDMDAFSHLPAKISIEELYYDDDDDEEFDEPEVVKSRDSSKDYPTKKSKSNILDITKVKIVLPILFLWSDLLMEQIHPFMCDCNHRDDCPDKIRLTKEMREEVTEKACKIIARQEVLITL